MESEKQEGCMVEASNTYINPSLIGFLEWQLFYVAFFHFSHSCNAVAYTYL